MRTNGNAGRDICKAGKRSLFRRSGLTVKCQTAETGRGTASLSQGAHRLHWESKKKCLSGDRCFPKFSSLGAESCEAVEAVAGWAAG